MTTAVDALREYLELHLGEGFFFILKSAEYNVDVAGKICMGRFGQGFRGNKVQNAFDNDCIGVILFSDPAGWASMTKKENTSNLVKTRL